MFWGFQTFSFYRLITVSFQIRWIDIFANSQITSMTMKKNTPFGPSHSLSPVPDSPTFWLLSPLPLLLHPLKCSWNTLAKFISEDLQLSNPNCFFQTSMNYMRFQWHLKLLSLLLGGQWYPPQLVLLHHNSKDGEEGGMHLKAISELKLIRSSVWLLEVTVIISCMGGYWNRTGKMEVREKRIQKD